MRSIPAFGAFLLLLTVSACDNPVDIGDFTWTLVSQQQAAAVKAELKGRVFQQFYPSRTGDPRKSVVLDFHKGLSVRAQHLEGGVPTSDWKAYQDFYWIEKAHGHPVYRFDLRNPTVERLVPEPKDRLDVPDVAGLSVLVRDYFKEDEIQFALADSAGHLPPPFPVFADWTRFMELDAVVDLYLPASKLGR